LAAHEESTQKMIVYIPLLTRTNKANIEPPRTMHPCWLFKLCSL